MKSLFLLLILTGTSFSLSVTNTAGAGTSPASDWTNPNNITLSAPPATFHVASGATGTTGLLVGSSFGFSIPGGSVINGIAVSFLRNYNGTTPNTYTTNTIQLYKAGSAAGTAKTGVLNWTGTVTTESYGSSTDLWGTTWSPSDINNSGFGYAITVSYDNGSVSNATLQVNLYQITVYYTSGGFPHSQVGTIVGM